jgi:hypothetical protein
MSPKEHGSIAKRGIKNNNRAKGSREAEKRQEVGLMLPNRIEWNMCDAHRWGVVEVECDSFHEVEGKTNAGRSGHPVSDKRGRMRLEMVKICMPFEHLVPSS